MFEGFSLSFGPDDGEERPQLSNAEFAAMQAEPLPAEYAHFRPFGSDPDVFVVAAAETGPGGQTLPLVTAAPPTALSSSGLSLGLQALEQLSAHVEAVKAQFTAAIAGPAPADRRARWDDFSAQEVAAATRCSDYAADRKIAFARDLDHRLRSTRVALAGGRISYPQALELSESTRHLTDRVILAEIETGMLRYAHRQDLTRFRAALRGWLARKDPDWVPRAQRARREVVVEHRANDNGTGEIHIRGPLEHTHLIDLALAGRAAQLTPEVGGTVAERKFAVLRDWADAALTAPGAPTRHGMGVRVDIVAQESTVLGHDEQPVEIPGVGMLPPDAARWALADGAPLRRYLTDATTGTLRTIDPTRYLVSPQLADLLISRYVLAAAPHCHIPAAGADIEHNIPHPAGPSDEHNLTPVSRRWHRAKTHGHWTYTKDPDTAIITWKSPTGLTIDIDPYNYRSGP